jgi:hypothetical protein
MTEESDRYIYINGEYDHAAMHRKLLTFDPRNTNNIMILDYLNIRMQNRKHGDLYTILINNEMKKYGNAIYPMLPISFKMLYHQFNIEWVDLIHQMLFIDGAYNTFYGEYKTIIDKILMYDTADVKESLIYRYYNTGETIFHTAAKTWILEKFDEKRNILITKRIESIDQELKYVTACYNRLEDVMNKKFSIVYMTDFYGTALLDYLLEFTQYLKEEV